MKNIDFKCSKSDFDFNPGYNLQNFKINSLPTNLETLKPKRLHVSNIPFRYRESDLSKLFSVIFKSSESRLSYSAILLTSFYSII